MSSRIWPTPTPAEEAAASAAATSPFLETCDSCGCLVEECECDDEDEEDTCETCHYVDCACYEVYVIYSTKVTVAVDSDGDVSRVFVSTDLDDLVDVQDEEGASMTADVSSMRGRLRARAAEAVQNQDWPSWDFD